MKDLVTAPARTCRPADRPYATKRCEHVGTLDATRAGVTSVVQIVEHPRRLRRSAWVSQSVLRPVVTSRVELELAECDRDVASSPQPRKRSSAMMTRRAALGGVMTAMVVAGCGDRDASTSSTPREVDYRSVGPTDFALLAERSSTFVLNVHTPDEGNIPGTDAAIPYDQLERRAGELPDRSTVVAVYCRTGRMCTEAVSTLRELGFHTDHRAVRGHGSMAGRRATALDRKVTNPLAVARGLTRQPGLVARVLT